jgi:hypothetical protein
MCVQLHFGSTHSNTATQRQTTTTRHSHRQRHTQAREPARLQLHFPGYIW